MDNVVGAPARGDNFFYRSKEIKQIADSLSAGNHMQLVAPRRVGKTSILMHFLDEGFSDFVFVYLSVEDVYSQEDYLKRICKKISRSSFIGGIKKMYDGVSRFANYVGNKIKVIDLQGVGVELNKDKAETAYEKFERIVSSNKRQKLVLMIDEFTEAILNIKDKHGKEAAVEFLKINRSLRLNNDGNVIFVFAGSSSLNHVVAEMDETSLINDLTSLDVGMLSSEESKNLNRKVLGNDSRMIDDEVLDYLVDKIEYRSIYYIQLLLQQVIVQSRTNEYITIEVIDKAYDELFSIRNSNYFDHYKSRINTVFKGAERRLVYDVLGEASKGILSQDKCDELVSQHSMEASKDRILNRLVFDGYLIINHGEIKFVSPILKKWWYINEYGK